MRKQLKSIVVAGMIATLSFATLAGCGSKSTAKNDETTISDTVKQTQKQTEKATEATTEVESTAAEEVTTEAESTEAEASGDAIVAAEPANEVVAADEPVGEPVNTPADTSSNEPAYVPADTPAEEPADNTPAPAEPAAHEHNWVPTYACIYWYTDSFETDETEFENGEPVIDPSTGHPKKKIGHHYDFERDLVAYETCECGATKEGKDKARINELLNTKPVCKNGYFEYQSYSDDDFVAKRMQTEWWKEWGIG